MVFEVTGGPTVTSNIKISVFDDTTADQNLDSDQVALLRSGISVFDGATAIIQDGVVLDPNVDMYVDADGSIYLIGMMEDWRIEVDGTSSFDRIKIEDARRLILKGDPGTPLGSTVALVDDLGITLGAVLTLTVDGTATNFTVLGTSTVSDLIAAWDANANIDSIVLADDGTLVFFLTEDFNGPSDMTLADDDGGSDLLALLGLSEGEFRSLGRRLLVRRA